MGPGIINVPRYYPYRWLADYTLRNKSEMEPLSLRNSKSEIQPSSSVRILVVVVAERCSAVT